MSYQTFKRTFLSYNVAYTIDTLFLVESKTLLDSLDLLLSCLVATLVATSTLERRILNLDVELDLRLGT